MKHIYDPKDCEEYFTVTQLREEFDDLEYNGLDLTKVIYSFDLLGLLHTFKKTAKGLSCYDTCGNYVYFKLTDKFKFYKVNLMYSTS